MEDFDLIAPKLIKGSVYSSSERRLLELLKSHLDAEQSLDVLHRGVYILAITNLLSSIDEEIYAPTRLDNKIHVNISTREQRYSLLQSFNNGNLSRLLKESSDS